MTQVIVLQLTLGENEEEMREDQHNMGEKGRESAGGMGGYYRMRRGCVSKEERDVYPTKPISHNAKPSSDAPQTKQTEQPIR